MALDANQSSRIASAAASNNATIAKAGEGAVHSIIATNTSAAIKFLKIYDKATAPVPATDAALLRLSIGIPATTAMGLNVGGMRFRFGISYVLVALAADTDDTAVVAGDIQGLNITFN